jgi:recombination protein RecA
MAFINQQFGAGTMVPASDPRWEVKLLPTGLSPIDHLLQGGIPFGRFVMFHGDYSTLKSYVGLCAIASAQKRGLIAALIDTEHAFDPAWAKSLGVNLDDLIMPPYDKISTGEKAIDMAESLIRGGVDLIVFDSVAATLPQVEQQQSMEEKTQMARQAALMSKAMRKLTAVNKKTAVIWINQTRVNIGVMFGNPESIPGGKALPFYSSYIVGLYKGAKVKSDIAVYLPNADGKPVKKVLKQTTGQQIRAVLAKSKLNAPHRETTFTFSHATGSIDDWEYLANIALSEGLIGYERGRWWRGNGKKMTAEQFRGSVDLAALKTMLAGKVEGVQFAGDAPRDNKKVVAPKPKSSVVITRKPTRTAARVPSRSTARLRVKSSK